MLETNQWTDIWRIKNPDKFTFTWKGESPTKASARLDYIILANSMTSFVEDIDTLPGFHSDHSCVQIILFFEHFGRGRGFWKVNTKSC